MAGYLAPRPLTNSEIYSLWAEVYDEQPNPLLSLEDRVLGALLPQVSGRDVLDLGCGTGRWLARLAQMSPAHLCGIDVSAEMLERAAHKVGTRAQLYQGDCATTPFPTASTDIAIASFVISHLIDPGALAGQISRVLRPDGSAFISDLHPDTVERLGWSRSFRSQQGLVHLGTEKWRIPFLASLFERSGLEVVAHIEARFGPPELELLRKAGRSAITEAAATHPAIYVLQLRKRHGHKPVGASRSARVQSVTGCNLALTSTDKVLTNLTLEHTRIAALTPAPFVSKNHIDLGGYTVLPGLINSHDHLEFALFPRLGHRKYQHFVEWADDIHRNDSATIARHRSIPKSTRIWWGALRNLLSGVTTVCHHNPPTDDMMAEDFPVRVVRNVGWAHSVPLDATFAKRHHRTPQDWPFVIHLGEGTGPTSTNEFTDLVAGGALDDRTVIVHGLSCGPDAVRRMNRKHASLIWCPTSNVFLFGRTHDHESLGSFENVAIGSDSSLTCEGDLLDEIRFARHHTSLSDDALYRLATTEAARILRLESGTGMLRVGATADLIAIRDSDLTPAAALSGLSYRDVHLVLRAGRVQLASSELLHRIPEHLSQGLRPLEIDGHVRWVRAPLGRMFRDVDNVLGGEVVMNGRRMRNVITNWL